MRGFRGLRWAIILLAVLDIPAIASASTTIRIGTLAPRTSPWGQTLAVWAEDVQTKSDGQPTLNITYNGGQGDEGAMANKLKSGQLDGAAMTAVGLGKLHQPVLAMQMSGLCSNWSQVNAVRNSIGTRLEKDLKQAGFTLVEWFDVGIMRIFSKGFAVWTPNDLKTRKPFR